MPALTPALSDKRFLFVTGKGGTGKTTVTAALALRLAAQGKRVLCAMCQAKERLSRLLDGPAVGEEIVELQPRIFAVNMNPDAALTQYGHMVLRVRPVYHAVMDNPFVRAFFRATPGLNEWAMLGKAWYHTTERGADGAWKYDTVILDAPATGHGLDMLRGPKVIVDVAPPGLLRREAARAWSLFSDPNQAGIVVVTLPEEMPVSETFELLDAVDRELHLPVAQVVVNGVLPPILSPAEREALLRHGTDPAAPGDEALAVGARRAIREALQQESLERLRAGIDAAMTELPLLPGEVDSLAAVRQLATRFV